MMVLGNDPLDSFLNSIEVVKSPISPLESNFRKVSKNFEHCFNGVSKNGILNSSVSDTNIELVAAQVDVKRKGSTSIDHHMVVDGDEKKKMKLPVKIFVGMFAKNCGNDAHNNVIVSPKSVEKLNVSISKKGLKERHGSDSGVKEEGNLRGNCLHFMVAWSVLINSFVQSIPTPFKSGKKQVQKMTNKDSFRHDDSPPKVTVKLNTVGQHKQKELKVKEGKDLPFEYLLGFVFGQLSHLPKFDVCVHENSSKKADCETSAAPVNQFDHFRARTSILEGKGSYLNGFLGNLKFARVGGVPSSIVEVPSVKEVGDERIDSAVSQEDNGGNSQPKLANGLLSVPLSNVERLRSTLSTISLTEIIELLPQMGRPSKEDYPDKKKLFSVQDFFRYTEAEAWQRN